MTWEYLQTEELDPRLMVIAGYLAKKIAGKTILDINCGSCRLGLYLPEDWKGYYANDCSYDFISLAKNNNPKAVHLKEKDEAIPILLQKKKIDIVIIYGYGADDKNYQSGEESATIYQTLSKVVKQHQPEIVIIEGSHIYDKETGLISKAVKSLKDYQLKHSIYVASDLQKRHYQRLVYILEHD